jgi:outer membrane protein assembly factor BamB
MKRKFAAATLSLLLASTQSVLANDWPSWRGPEQNGVSRETGLPESWDPDTKENVVWQNEKITGMSSPVVMNGKLYTWTRVGETKWEGTTIVSPKTQEALICADADTGKILWEHRVNMYQTEVPFHRLGWGNVVADPQSKRVYGYGVQGTLVCLDGETGKLVWQHQMFEEYGQISTFGGRTQSPAVDEDTVFLTGVAFGWGDNAQGQHRCFAFDKNTGELRWTNGTGGRPVDAPQGTPVVGVVNGVRIVAFGAGDGGVYGFKARTGEKVFGYKLSKRGINTTVLLVGDKLIAGSSEENADTPVMGRVVGLDLSQVDPKTQAPKELWRIDGLEAGFASPTVQPDGKVAYVPDNKGTVHAVEVQTGKTLWKQGTGTIGRPSLVWADNKIYAAEANGRFSIIQPPEEGKKKAKVLSKVEIASDAQALGREYYVYGSPAVSNGRLFLQTAGGTWCIGPKDAKKQDEPVPAMPKEEPADKSAAAAVVQVVPADVILKSGEKATFKVRTFDDKGRLIGEAAQAKWSIEPVLIPPPPTAPEGTQPAKAGNLKGSVDPSGAFTADAAGIQAGAVAATVDVGGKQLMGKARVRVMPEPPYKIDFEQAAADKPPLTWINVGGKFAVRQMPDGNKVLVKLLNLDLYHLARTYFGRPELSNYTIEADVMVDAKKVGDAMYIPDAGVIAGRYGLTLAGNHQRIYVTPWTGALPKQGQQGESLYKAADYKWTPQTWYHLKLSVQPNNGSTMVRGKVWKKGESEPEGWAVELNDTQPNTNGAPGLYGESLVTPFKSEIYYDNIAVTPNK